MILILDNYDSFTYNLYQYIREVGREVEVHRSDRISIGEIEQMRPEAIILSPGPGTPEKAGICISAVQRFYTEIPILGICLGHQAIACAFGGRVVSAKSIRHGKTSHIVHNGDHFFAYMQQPLEVMRYHSLAVDRATLPAELYVTATSMEDGEIMAICHGSFPVFGVQFHPESIGTKDGKQMIFRFLQGVRDHSASSSGIE